MKQTTKTDDEIKKLVERELKWECRVGALPITVAVKNGLVTLSGVVRTYLNKLAAERRGRHATEKIQIPIGISKNFLRNSLLRYGFDHPSQCEWTNTNIKGPNGKVSH